jgi:hypothetical protein
MDIDLEFLPAAEELVTEFATPIVYQRDEGSSYDPATGDVTANVVNYAINAGVLSRGRIEAGGTAETYELRLWIDHSASGLPHLPTTADRVIYDGTTWKINNIEPTYSSKGLIASKITARNQ